MQATPTAARSSRASSSSPSSASPRRLGAEAEGEPRTATPPRTASSCSRRRRPIDGLPGGAQPAPPRDERDHLGRRRLPHRVRLHLEVGLPGHQGRHGRPHRAIQGDLDAAEAQRTEAARDPRRVPGPARRRPHRVGPHHRGGPSGRRRGARPTLAGQGRGRRRRAADQGRPPTSRPPRSRPSPTSAARWPPWPSAPPSRSWAATSTATPTSPSWRPTSTRSGRTADGRRPHHGVRRGTLRGRPGRRPPRRGRGRAVPGGPGGQGERRAA